MTTTYLPSETDAPSEPPAEDIEALLDLDDEEFALVVSDALFYAVGPIDTEPDWQCLFHPYVVARTRTTLGTTRLAIQATQTRARRNRDSRAQALASQQLSAIQVRQSQAKAIKPERSAEERQERRDRHVEYMEEQAREARNSVRLLAFAIQGHRLKAIQAGLEPEPSDRELWNVLDQIQLTIGTQPRTLTEILGAGIWTESRDR